MQAVKVTLNSTLTDDLSALSSDINYFLIFPYSYKKIQANRNGPQPQIFAYKSDQITIQEMLVRYKKSTKCSIPEDKIVFTLHTGFQISKETGYKVENLKKQMKTFDLNGVAFYIQQQNFLIEQCASILFVTQELSFKTEKQISKVSEVQFVLEQNNDSFYKSIHMGQKIQSIKTIVVTEIQRLYSINVKAQDIIFKKKNQKAQYYTIPVDNNNLLKDFLEATRFIFYVSFIKSDIKVPKRSVNLCNTIIFRGKALQKQVKTYYDEIKSKKVVSILRQLGIAKVQEYVIKLFETYLRPDQDMAKIDKYFNNSLAGNGKKNLVAKVIHESAIFYKEIKEMKNKRQFDIQKIGIDTQPQNEIHRTQCENSINNRAKNAKHAEFKNAKNVSPILYYTSKIMYKEINGSRVLLYKGLNDHLRNQKFAKIQKESQQYYNWKNIYTGVLIDQLLKIQKVQKTVYRGVNTYSVENKGDILQYKQFLSTSTDQTQALKFAYKTLYIIQTKSGRPIEDYSYFQYQKEILLLPYSKFKVISISQMKNPQKNGIEIKVVHLEEIQYQKMPQTITNFLIWVDDKTKEAKIIFDNLKKPIQTTILIQFISTQELQIWLKENYKDLDGKSNIAMITNMSRVEKKVKNQIAGIQAINAMRKYKDDIKILVFIGYIQGANQKLKVNKVNMKNIKVGNLSDQAQNFILENCGGQMNPEELKETHLYKNKTISELPSHNNTNQQGKAKKSVSTMPQGSNKNACKII